MKDNEPMRDLLEQADDAYFSVLLSDYAARQGDALLEESERLNADAALAYPDSLDRSVTAEIAGIGKRQRRARVRRALKKGGRIAAVVIAVIILSFGVLMGTVDAVRVNVLNGILAIYEEAHPERGTTLFFSEPDIGQRMNRYELLWTPDDYKCEEMHEVVSMYTWYYTNDAGGEFEFMRMSPNSGITFGTVVLDETLTIAGRSARYFETDTGERILTWTDEQEFIYMIFSTVDGPDRETILLMGERYYG